MSEAMLLHEQPVVFCFIAWMKNYKGATTEDTPLWDSARAENGEVRNKKSGKYYLAESTNFLRARDIDGKLKVFGHVQASIATDKLGGSKEVANNVTVIWCAADMRDGNRIKLVGWYRNATIYRSSKKITDIVSGRDQKHFARYDGYTVVADFSDAKLIDESKRPSLPVTPGKSELGRWHAQSKNWKGDESRQLLSFIARWIAKDGRLLRAKKASKKTPITRTQILATVRERQGQSEFRRELLVAYQEQCALSGSRTLALLDACHIYPASKDDSYHGTSNGLLLRTDLHTLFDLGLVRIHPKTKTVWVSPDVKDDNYMRLKGKKLDSPMDGWEAPSKANLEWHWNETKKGK